MKFFKLFFLSFLIVVTGISVFAQKTTYSSLTIPEELKNEANDVVRLDYTNLTVESKKEASLHIKYAVTLLNNKSQKHTQFVTYDKDEKINNLNAKIYDAFGNEVRKFNKNDFSDKSAVSGSTMYSDSRYKEIDLSYSKFPYTIEIEYKKSFNGVLDFPNCYIQEFNSSVENLMFIAEMPSDLEIRYKVRNIELEPQIEKTGKKTIYTWTVKNLPALKYEEFLPSVKEIVPIIEVSPSVFQYGQYVGNMTSWNSLGKFYFDLYDNRDQISPELAAAVKTLTNGLGSDREKIAVLYNYLKENMRYVSVQLGIGGLQPFDASYVEKNKYGDCKALSNFMYALLKEVGIKAQPGIIYRDSDKRQNADEDFPTIVFGNHVLLYVPSEDIWLECTSNYYPVNYIGASNDNRSVLLLTAEGGKLTKSPAFSITDNTEHSKLNFIINEDGSANVQGNLITKGPKHELYRYIENEISKEEFEDYFLKTSDLPAFSIESLELKSNEDRPEANLDFDITVGRYATKAGKRLFIPLNRLNAFSQVPSQTEERIHPIEVIRGYQEIDENTFQIPKGYEVESIPKKEINLETDYGKYKIKIEIESEGSTIKYHRILEIQPVKLPPEEFVSFRNFYKEVAKADDMKIVLVKKKT